MVWSNKIPLIYTLLAFLTAVLVFDPVFDDSYDAFASAMSAGQFTDFPLMDQHYLGVLLIRDLYKLIQSILPQVNVFASMYILSSVASLYYVLWTLQRLVSKHVSLGIQHLTYCIFSLIFIENIVSITHTRFATVLAGVALINLTWGHNERRQLFVHYLIFLFGMLTRPESAMGVLMIVGFAYFIFKLDVKMAIRKMIFPSLSLLILITIFYIHRAHTNRFEIKIEPDIEYALSTNRIVPISQMPTKLDSLRYSMATRGMFIDTTFVTVSFLRSIIDNSSSVQIEDIQASVLNVAFFYTYYPIYGVAFAVLTIVCWVEKKWRILIQMGLLHIFVFTTLVILDYHVTIADRHFSGLFQVSTLLFIVLFANSIKTKYALNSLKTMLLGLGLFGGTGVSVAKGLGNQHQVSKEVECQETTMESIDGNFVDRTIIVTHITFHLMDRKYSFLNQNYANNKYMIYDISNYSIVPRNLEYLSRQCACNASVPSEFFAWMEKEKAVLLGASYRLILMQQYMNLVHDQNTNFRSAIPDKDSIEISECLIGTTHDDFVISTVQFNEP